MTAACITQPLPIFLELLGQLKPSDIAPQILAYRCCSFFSQQLQRTRHSDGQ